VNNQPSEIGKIIVTMLEAGNYPTYPESEIKAIVEILYNLNEKVYADQICNKYGEEGYYFLKEVYYSNNKMS
jgi:predicted SAM-dependent methyltransferase